MEQLNLNNKYNFDRFNPNFRATSNVVAQPDSNVQIPDIYYNPNDKYEQKSFKETVKQYDMMQLVYPWLAHPFLMIGSCTGLALGVDKLAHSFGGEYEKSLLYKVAHLGDKMQNSKLVQSNFIQKTINGIKKGHHSTINFLKKSDTIKAILETPSMPEWAMPKGEMISQERRITEEFVRIADTLGLSSEGYKSGGGTSPFAKFGKKKAEGHLKISNLGLNKEEKSFLKNHYNVNKLSALADKEGEAANRIVLRRLGRSESEIATILANPENNKLVGNEILKEMGLTRDFIDGLKKDHGKIENIAKVKEAVAKVHNKVWIGAGNYNWLGKFQIFARKIGCDDVNNRFRSISDVHTRTGRLMAKATQLLHRGFTFGGGKLGVLLFVSPLIVDTILNTKKADPDKKVGTAAHGILGFGSWVITFPLALKIFHAFGGMKYAGMSKDEVELYRNKIKEFNENNKKGNFATHDAYKTAKDDLKKELKDLLNKNSKNQTLLTRISKRIGRFLTMDLEKINSWNSGNAFKKVFSRKYLGNGMKNCFGVPMRFALWGVISMLVLEGAISKGLDKIFGKEYDAMKEEEHTENKKAQKQFTKEDLDNRLLELQQEKINSAQEKNAPASATENQNKPIIQQENKIIQKPQEEITQQNNVQIPDHDKLQQDIKNPQNVTNNQPEENKYIPNQNNLIKNKQNISRDNYTYIPSQENTLGKNKKEYDENKYIPSQKAGNFVKTYDNSHLSDALKRADKAEQLALQTLAGKFGNM